MLKKVMILLLSLMLLSGCTKSSEFKSILSPAGAPALSVIPFALEEKEKVSIVNGSENLLAAFVAPESEYSIIIAPINLGINLINNNKTKFKLHSVVTWGNLFIVRDVNNTKKKIALFGDKAVPGLVYNNVKKTLGYSEYEELWVPSVADAQKALLSGEVSVALLAEPVVSASMAKAKELNKELIIDNDVQKAYAAVNGVSNYPQAGLFILEGSNYEDQIKKMSEYVDSANSDSMQLIKDIESLSPEYLGVPNAQIIGKALPNMNVKVKKASDVQAELESFLKLFNLELSENAIIK